MGGIGTGNVSIGARGELRDWEIFNAPGRGTWLPYSFFAVRVAGLGVPARAKVLESRLRPPYERPVGAAFDVPGLPRLQESHLRGEYPFAWVDFVDDELPISVSLEAFTPLVPLDAAASGLPVAILRYVVRNTADRSLHVAIAGSVANAVGFDGYHERLWPRFRGDPRNDFRQDGGLSGLHLTSSLPPEHLQHGSMALTTADRNVTAKATWIADNWSGAEDLWDDFLADGQLAEATTAAPTHSKMVTDAFPPRVLAAWRPTPRVGSLAVGHDLAPDEVRVFEFVLAWHFPNRPGHWTDKVMASLTEEPPVTEVVRNHYATSFEDAWHVARHVHELLPELESHTRAFHDMIFGSSLPGEVVDAVASNVATARSTTCFRLDDGTFAGWEGTLDASGSCAGSCTHVWSYAQTVAFLWPELERTMRRVELGLETDDDGRMSFRTNRIFGGPSWRLGPAVDGQLGTIVRLHREWSYCGDDDFLTELWPNAVRALEYAFDHWDDDGDLVLDGELHNTFDIEFHGPEARANTLFYAALLAGAALAEHLGDIERAQRYRDAAEHGAEAMDRLLWNGQYYVQRLDGTDARPHQYGAGCLSDQLLGQLLAHISGLGHVLPAEHVRRALAAICRHNFRSDLSDHHHVKRIYAFADEAGLLLCTWPHGGRPAHAFEYCDEVWTGIEYQVAAHLIYEGLVDEGLAIVRAVRERHDGYRRNPWNEFECGGHYARSMASWALLLACSGYRYDASRGALSFAPAIGADDFRCFFSTGSGWGTFAQDPTGASIALAYGSLEIADITLQPPPGVLPSAVALNGRAVPFETTSTERGTTLTMPSTALAAGDVLLAAYTPQ